jgi:formylglycine-generating enzyme required for sulfatase activity
MNRDMTVWVGLLLAFIATIGGIATPEVRCLLGLQSETCLGGKNKAPPPPSPPKPTATVVVPPAPVTPPPVSTTPVTPVPPVPVPTTSPAPVVQPQPGQINFSDLFNPKRDEFESQSQFQERRQQLLITFNQAVSQHDPRYQAGVTHLGNYDADHQIYPIQCDWQPWVKKFSPPKQATLPMSAAEAKIFKQDGTDKQLFIKITEVVGNLIKREGLSVGQNGQSWSFTLPPTPELMMIPAGQFQLGDVRGIGGNDEQPVHTVAVKSFALGRYELTFEEYDYFAEQTGRKKPEDEDWGHENSSILNNISWVAEQMGKTKPKEAELGHKSRPIINISWHDATAYVEWLSTLTGEQYRLPTEAEWEYAARGGTETDYWWGNEVGTNQANCTESGSQWSSKQSAPVGSFAPNPYGLYDTVGNVWEWTCSAYEEKYGEAAQRCVEKNDNRPRVSRSGSWYTDSKGGRSAARGKNPADYWSKFAGLRVLCTSCATGSP